MVVKLKLGEIIQDATGNSERRPEMSNSDDPTINDHGQVDLPQKTISSMYGFSHKIYGIAPWKVHYIVEVNKMSVDAVLSGSSG